VSLPFPCDRNVDRGALDRAPRPDPEPSLAPGTPVDSFPEGAVSVRPRPSAAPSGNPSRCDSCVMGFHCNALHTWCECRCTQPEDEEERVGFQAIAEGCAYYDEDEGDGPRQHENDEVLDALRRERAIASPDQLLNERYGYGAGHGQRWAL
jgi:hypothetical protein